MIELEALSAREPPVALAPLTLSLGAGVHALLGTRQDGVALLLDVIAARVAPRAGRVRIAGALAHTREARRSRAHVTLEPSLPDVLRVDEVLAMASSARGQRADPRGAAARLDVLGLAALATRTMRSLTRGEARGVALAEALTSTAKVLLVDEPFLDLDPRAGASVARALRARAADGACVVVATASLRDALDLDGEVLSFARGALVGRATAGDPRIVTARDGVRLRVVAEGTRALLAAVASDPAVRAVHAEPGALVLVGDDLVALAASVARAVLRANAAASDAAGGGRVRIDSLRADAAPLDEVRAAIGHAMNPHAPPPSRPSSYPPAPRVAPDAPGVG